MNPKYFHEFLETRIGPPIEERLKRDRSKRPCNCCGNHLSQWQMTAQGSKSLKMGYQVGNSQENSTRSLCLIRVLYIQNTYSPCYILMSTSFLTQGHYVVYMCSDIIFQILLLCSRPMMSHHVTCHVTAMSHASSLSLKRKRKRKILVSKAFHNSNLLKWKTSVFKCLTMRPNLSRSLVIIL